MANCYTTLATIKDAGVLGITGSTYDAQITRIIEESSRMIDNYTERFFYIYEGTIYQDGGSPKLVLDWDLQELTTLLLDEDGDGTFETSTDPTTAPVDFFQYPLNKTPKIRLEINSGGSIGGFAPGVQKGIQMTGLFGYGADWPESYTFDSGTVVASDITSTGVTLTASTPGSIEAGMTLRIGSEQLFVPVANTTSATIERAKNGTTAAAATTGTAITIYDYPQAIKQATLIQAIRTWKRRESAYVNAIINTDMGSIQVFKGLDADVKEIINQYRRTRYP